MTPFFLSVLYETSALMLWQTTCYVGAAVQQRIYIYIYIYMCVCMYSITVGSCAPLYNNPPLCMCT